MGTAAPVPAISPSVYSSDVEQSKSALATLYQNISTGLGKIADITDAMPDTARDGRSATEVIAEKMGALQTQQEIQNIKKSVNFDQLAVSLSQDINDLAVQRNKVADTIAKKSAVSLWDDPLQALANAFTMPWDEQQKEGLDESISSRQKQLDAANHNVQNSAATELATTQKFTTEGIAATADVMAKTSLLASAAARLDVFKSQAQGITAVMNLEKDQLDAYYKAAELRNQAARLALEQTNSDRMIKMYNLQMQKETNKEKADADYLGMVNIGIQNSGGTPIDVNRLATLKQTSGEYIDAMAKQGILISTQPPGTVTQGATVPERLHFQAVTQWKPDPKLPAQGEIMAAQGAAYQAATVSGSKDKTAVAQFAQKQFNDQVDLWKSNIKTNDQSNPFIAPSYNTIQKTKIAANPLWQKYVVPTISNSNANLPVDPQRVLDSLAVGVANKEIDPLAAGDFMADIFRQGIAINNTVNQYKKIANVEQTDYKVKLSTMGLGMGFAQKPVNVADPVIAANLIVQAVVGKSTVNYDWAGRAIGNAASGELVPYLNEDITPGRTQAEKDAAAAARGKK